MTDQPVIELVGVEPEDVQLGGFRLIQDLCDLAEEIDSLVGGPFVASADREHAVFGIEAEGALVATAFRCVLRTRVLGCEVGGDRQNRHAVSLTTATGEIGSERAEVDG